MLAWVGGKRKIVKMRNARRKLEGVFNKVATKPVRQTRKPPTAAQVDSLANDFSTLDTNHASKQPRRSLRNAHSNNNGAGGGDPAPAQAQPVLVGGTSGGTSLDILAILREPMRTVSNTQDIDGSFEQDTNMLRGQIGARRVPGGPMGASTHHNGRADTPRAIDNPEQHISPDSKPSGTNADGTLNARLGLGFMEL